MAWFRRLWNVVRPNRLSRDLEREMSFHLSERTEELVASGLSESDASCEARRRFGSRTLQTQRTRDADTLVWFESLAADLRYAVRALAAAPGFALVAILSLALGIGANTAIFSLTNALVLKALPVSHPEELVKVTMGSAGNDTFTNPLWEQIRDHASVFSGAFAFWETGLNLSAGGEARHAPGAWVSGDFFATLGLQPGAGRLFQASDDFRSCPAVAVVSDGFARREHGSPARAVDAALSIDGHPFEIVGVTEPGFFGIEVGRSTGECSPSPSWWRRRWGSCSAWRRPGGRRGSTRRRR